MSQTDWLKYAAKELFSTELMNEIHFLEINNDKKSELLMILIQDKFEKKLGIKFKRNEGSNVVELIDEKNHIYIVIDAECESYKKWQEAMFECYEKDSVHIYIGFMGYKNIYNESFHDFDLGNSSNLIVLDPIPLNNITLDLIRLKIQQWCGQKVKLSKFNEKASSE